MRVAYVEDNSTNLALVERVASMNHHVIVSYTEGEIALRELMREKVDLILMDVELAGELSGLQVVRGLRAQGLTTPIIAVTAYAMMGDREKCLEAGCTGYLPKPLPIPELVSLLNHYDELVKQQVPEVAGATVMANPGATPAPTSEVAAPPAPVAPAPATPVPAAPESAAPAPAAPTSVTPAAPAPSGSGALPATPPPAPVSVPVATPAQPVPPEAPAPATDDKAQATTIVPSTSAVDPAPNKSENKTDKDVATPASTEKKPEEPTDKSSQSSQ